MKLYMIMLGCKPEGRCTEQHDIFFGIGKTLKDLIPEINAFWPEAKGKIHIDAWREVTVVDDFAVSVVPKNTIAENTSKLFFINLGGYKKNEFEEYHYKILNVATSLAEASKKAKSTSFYKHFGFEGAVSHIDDKYGIDVDDVYNVEDILPRSFKEQFKLQFSKRQNEPEDEFHIGYLKIEKLLKANS